MTINFFKCDICYYETNRKDNYERHLKCNYHYNKFNNTQKIKKNFKCDICDYKTDRNVNYKRHLDSDSHKFKSGQIEKKKDKEIFKCNNCHYESFKKFNFDRHVNKCIPQDIVCIFCDLKFNNNLLYEIHRTKKEHRDYCKKLLFEYKDKINVIKINYKDSKKINFFETVDWDNISDKNIISKINSIQKKIIEITIEISSFKN